ncbi:MAG: acyl carrier protein [Selenomonas sp.]|nr:acyl carrier protein [Selenomonas sp.]
MNEKFKEILNEVNPEILESEGVNLMEEKIIDSLMVMRIVTMAENVFNIDFEPDDILPENFTSPDIIWKTIQKYGLNE